MVKLTILPVMLATAVAVTGVTALAQDTAAPTTERAERAERPAPAARIRLDFGAGRKVEVNCGTTDLAACAAEIAPLVDKVAAMPVAEGMGKPHGSKGKHERHGKGDKKGQGDMASPEGHPAPPPAEAPAGEGQTAP